MQQLAILVKLKEGSRERADELLRAGAPFDPADAGFDRHAVYFTGDEVVFVFEANEVEWLVDDLVDDPFLPGVADALDAWRPLADGEPQIARCVYAWSKEGTG